MSLLLHWQKAKDGETVTFRPRGNSMTGIISDGALVIVEPCDHSLLVKNDVVLVRVKGNIYLHKIIAVNGDRFQIGNNKGGVNGWAGFNNIAGKCISVDGKKLP